MSIEAHHHEWCIWNYSWQKIAPVRQTTFRWMANTLLSCNALNVKNANVRPNHSNHKCKRILALHFLPSFYLFILKLTVFAFVSAFTERAPATHCLLTVVAHTIQTTIQKAWLTVMTQRIPIHYNQDFSFIFIFISICLHLNRCVCVCECICVFLVFESNGNYGFYSLIYPLSESKIVMYLRLCGRYFRCTVRFIGMQLYHRFGRHRFTTAECVHWFHVLWLCRHRSVQISFIYFNMNVTFDRIVGCVAQYIIGHINITLFISIRSAIWWITA